MKKKMYYCIILILIINLFIYSQETTTTEQKEDTLYVESKLTPENISIKDINKKEEEIANLIDNINEKIINANNTNSLKMKKTILEQINELKLNLKNLTKEYAELIKLYNNKIMEQVKFKSVEINISENISDIKLQAYEKELKNLANKINEKVYQANKEFSEDIRKNYIQQIEQLKNEFFLKKSKYLKLVNEYNKQIEQLLKLYEEEPTSSQQ